MNVKRMPKYKLKLKCFRSIDFRPNFIQALGKRNEIESCLFFMFKLDHVIGVLTTEMPIN